MKQLGHTAQRSDVVVTLCVVAMAVPIVVNVVVPLPDGLALLDALIILFDLGPWDSPPERLSQQHAAYDSHARLSALLTRA
jgi:hypothetical protein